MLDRRAREAAEDRLRVRRAVPQRGGVLDHLVVLTLDERPINHPAEDRRQVVEQAAQLRVRQVELLPRDRLQPRRQLEAEQVAEGERHLALAMAVDVVALNVHVGAVAQHALDHGADL